MGTGVKQDANLAIAAARQNDRPAGDMSGAKIPRAGDLRFVASIDPALLEDAFCFQRQDMWVGEYAAIDAK